MKAGGRNDSDESTWLATIAFSEPQGYAMSRENRCEAGIVEIRSTWRRLPAAAIGEKQPQIERVLSNQIECGGLPHRRTFR